MTHIETPPVDPERWRQIISETAGSISDPTFCRHEQGEYEERTEIPGLKIEDWE